MRAIYLLLLISFTFHTAIQDKKTSENLIVIPFAKKISELSEIKCSQFIDKFEYIRLETNEKCLIGDTPHILVLKDHILIYEVKYCFVFDRKTGKFLYELSHYGRGPGEYNNSLLAYDFNRSILYSSGWEYNMIMHSLDGKYLGSFSIPNRIGGFENPSLMFQFSSLHNSLITGYSTNMLGSENKLLTVFNQRGKVIKVFPNRNIYPKQKMVLNLVEAQFYQMDDETFFKERYTDTLFKVTEKELIPHIVFEMAQYSVPYKSKWWPVEQQQKANIIVIQTVLENNFYVILRATQESLEYFGLYIKSQNKFLINKINSGFPNDIDNFIPFNPNFVDQYGNLVAIINPLEIVKWSMDNSSKLKYLTKETQELQKTGIEMNPIIMIGKTKTSH